MGVEWCVTGCNSGLKKDIGVRIEGLGENNETLRRNVSKNRYSSVFQENV